MSACPIACEVVEELASEWSVPSDAGIVITHMHYRWEEIRAIRRIVETTRVPVLILSDGVIEYRNTFDNPNIADGSIFQPVMGHKIACIGRSQARTIESWGNVGKCEIVGMPRLDSAIDAEFMPINTTGPFRLLIATASTPAFTKQQRNVVVRSLQDVKQRLDNHPGINGRPVEVQWRLTHGLDAELGIVSDYESLRNRPPLDEAIERADAVLTTPSTLFLESAIRRRPTAILDYSNSPSYFDSAWRITAPLHIQPTLSELASPPAPKLQYQRSSLHDQLECGTASQPRLFALIKSMIEFGVAARAAEETLTLPTRILSDPQRGVQVVESEFDRSVLYPDNEIFQNESTLRLQTELSHAIARLGQLPEDLIRKERHIAQMEVYLEEALDRVRESRRRESRSLQIIEQQNQALAKKTEHISKMDQHLQSSLNRIEQLKANLEAQTETAEALATFLIATRLFAHATHAEMPPEQLAPIHLPVSQSAAVGRDTASTSLAEPQKKAA